MRPKFLTHNLTHTGKAPHGIGGHESRLTSWFCPKIGLKSAEKPLVERLRAIPDRFGTKRPLVRVQSLRPKGDGRATLSRPLLFDMIGSEPAGFCSFRTIRGQGVSRDKRRRAAFVARNQRENTAVKERAGERRAAPIFPARAGLVRVRSPFLRYVIDFHRFPKRG